MIFTYAARPIFTKFGDENKLSAFIGVISAFISNFQRLGETLDYFIAGDYTFVFLLCGPIYLVCISNTGEAVSSLKTQLHLAHAQILSVLGGGIHETLEARPNYDVRQLMGGTELLLNDILTSCDTATQHIFMDVAPARLNKHTRAKAMAALRKHKPKSVLYGMLVAAGRVVAVHKHKDHALHAADVHVLLNVITNSQSLRAGEAWTPICLPAFSAQGFLYAYVCYLSPAVALCLVDSDPMAFPACAAAKVGIVASLAPNSDPDSPAVPADPNVAPDALDALAELELAARLQAWSPSEVDGAGPELLHVFYRSLTGGQCVISAPLGPYPLGATRTGEGDAQETTTTGDEASADASMRAMVAARTPTRDVARTEPLLMRYRQLFAKTHGNAPEGRTVAGLFTRPNEGAPRHAVYVESTADATLVMLARAKEFELYLTCLPLTGKEAALAAAHRVLRWVKREEPNLFLA